MLKLEFADEHLAVARWNSSILVLLFRGPVGAAQLEAARPGAHRTLRDASEGGGLLSIFERGAHEVDTTNRGTAAELIEQAGRVLKGIAYVYESEREQAALVARHRDVIARSGTEAPFRAFFDVAEAVSWLLARFDDPAMSDDADAFVEAIARLRRTRAAHA
jgi:hypothetical protein